MRYYSRCNLVCEQDTFLGGVACAVISLRQWLVGSSLTTAGVHARAAQLVVHTSCECMQLKGDVLDSCE